jgi:2-methylcitrate dehydratase PrpD
MSGASDVLVDHVLTLQWTALPASAQLAALSFLHDTLAVGVAGRHAPGADTVFALAQRWSGQAAPGCGMLGRPGVRATAPYAAFVNAFQIHSQEFDCVHEPAVAHPLATVLSALLAQAQHDAPVSGADLLAALVGGVDVVATLGVAATTPLKFFRPATCGIFGSVAALCRLRRLDRSDSINAFGHALAFASGTMRRARRSRRSIWRWPACRHRRPHSTDPSATSCSSRTGTTSPVRWCASELRTRSPS